MNKTLGLKNKQTHNRTDLGKCAHQYDKKQANNSTRALSTKIVFFGCKKIDNKIDHKIDHKDHKVFTFFFLCYLLEPEEDKKNCRKRSCIIVSLFSVVLMSTVP